MSGMSFKKAFALAEKYGYDSGTARVFDGKKFVLFNEVWSEKTKESFVRQLKAKGCCVRVVPFSMMQYGRTKFKGNRRIHGWGIYYRKNCGGR